MNSPGLKSNDSTDSKTSPSNPADDSRRRKPAANGRGVNTLSKEALDKKRDNDRKAQAAIRRRQKEEVANLKLQIEALNSQQPYLQLKSVIEEKNAIQDENEKLRAALTTIMDTIQPFIAPAIQDLAAAAHHSVQVALLKSKAPESRPPYSAPDSSTYHASSPFPAREQDLSLGSQTLPHRSLVNEQRDNIQRHHQFNKHESLDFRFLFDRRDARRESPTRPVLIRRHSAGNHSAPPSIAGDQESHQPWNILPLISEPDTPLDKLLTDFVRDHRQTTRLSRPPSYPTNPSILHLLNPLDSSTSADGASPDLYRHVRGPSDCDVSQSPDALSNYMTKLVSWFDGLRGLPEKVAVCYIMYGVLRWQIYPNKENYCLMPEMMRPCGSQLTVRHPASFDHLPWPRMRDKMIQGNHDGYRLGRKLFDSFTENLSVNWPFSETTCLANTGRDGQEEISPAFLEHISRLESWTLGSDFFNAFPELRGTAPIRDKIRPASNLYLRNEQMRQGARDIEMDAEFATHRDGYSYDYHGLGNIAGRDLRGG